MSGSGYTPEEITRNFLGLVMMKYHEVLFLLGILKAPGHELASPKLQEAAEMIDQLEALKVKTQGNLSFEENKTLEHILTELRLSYLKVAKDSESPKEKQSQVEQKLEKPFETDPEKRKFFKSYG
ncbi:DUF1844 domain-containing protein [Methylacidiphilum caldifontis]|uniref:DUF1844 domain-containing protein n=1 Tax=Methylacidiphilum caldifontis TaxID=2795386 RepID=A0A4Y8P9R3_9BACT|nr:DUF1844 domain-containing protein [Methylacidiphilum caldifontis]QSR89499.1 DUF1844 domain-containing protein [Methylacidiphilum caldifontis]TFE67207.1 hypothetical protein A7Q10_09805 [Methylacidiphilum caldifontis]